MEADEFSPVYAFAKGEAKSVISKTKKTQFRSVSVAGLFVTKYNGKVYFNATRDVSEFVLLLFIFVNRAVTTASKTSRCFVFKCKENALTLMRLNFHLFLFLYRPKIL